LEKDRAHWKQMAEEYLKQAQAKTSATTQAQKATRVMNQLVEELLGDMTPFLPSIKEAEDYFASFSPDLRRKVSVALSTEFAHNTREITSMEGEAIRKLRELRLRYALVLYDKHYATQLAAVHLKLEAEGLVKIQQVAQEYEGKLEGPMAQALRFFQANAVEHMAAQSEQRLHELAPSSLNAHALLMDAPEEDPTGVKVEEPEIEIIFPDEEAPERSNGFRRR
jgi:isoleucyl-tRNA synthetase